MRAAVSRPFYIARVLIEMGDLAIFLPFCRCTCRGTFTIHQPIRAHRTRRYTFMAFCNSAVTVLHSLLSSACMCCVWQYLLAYTQSAEILFRWMYKGKPQQKIIGVLPQEAKGENTMQRFITDERTGIRYELIGDYYYPCLIVEESPPLSKYGRLRQRYLREHKRVLYFNLLTSGKLY